MRSKIVTVSLLVLLVVLAGCAPAPAATPTTAPAAPTAAAKAAAPTAAPTTAPTKPSAPSGTLTVLAAASLTEPFGELGKQFEAKNPGVKVAFSFAGSQQLAGQLDQGAQADVFASASPSYMNAAITSGRVVSGTAKTFVQNRLVVIYPQANPAGLKELKDLAKPGLKLVFAAKAVPVGQYALDYLDKAIRDPGFDPTYKDAVVKNVVSYEDNVKAVLTKVSLGEADAGIVYTTDISGDAAGKVGKLDIPNALNVVASYPIAVIKDSKGPDLAKAFMDLVLSAEGQQVMAKYGFVPVAAK